jgi:uncharacterized protein YndB with AHSA1/START domain
MGSVESIGPYLEPVRKTIVVARTPAEAFETFTGRIASWWPTAKYSIHQGETAACGIEPRVGGEVWETSRSGERCTWGKVVAWEPPRRFVMTWHPGREPGTAQEVEVRFTAVPGGTRVDLEHRGWATFGPGATEAHEGYDRGWQEVFGERFAAACA